MGEESGLKMAHTVCPHCGKRSPVLSIYDSTDVTKPPVPEEPQRIVSKCKHCKGVLFDHHTSVSPERAEDGTLWMRFMCQVCRHVTRQQLQSGQNRLFCESCGNEVLLSSPLGGFGR